MTLVKEFRSLSQEHERTGSKKVLRKKNSEVRGEVQITFGEKGAMQTKHVLMLSVGKGLFGVLCCPIWWPLATCGYLNENLLNFIKDSVLQLH